jgi:hypothetical protein
MRMGNAWNLGHLGLETFVWRMAGLVRHALFSRDRSELQRLALARSRRTVSVG